MTTLMGLVIARAHAKSVADQVCAMSGGWEREFKQWCAGDSAFLILAAHTERRCAARDPVAVRARNAMGLRQELRSLVANVRHPMHWTLALARDSDVLRTVLKQLPPGSVSEVSP